MQCDLHDSVPDWIIEHPETEIIFCELGLEKNCGGKSLEYLCYQQGLNPNKVLQRLRGVISASES